MGSSRVIFERFRLFEISKLRSLSVSSNIESVPSRFRVIASNFEYFSSNSEFTLKNLTMLIYKFNISNIPYLKMYYYLNTYIETETVSKPLSLKLKLF